MRFRKNQWTQTVRRSKQSNDWLKSTKLSDHGFVSCFCWLTPNRHFKGKLDVLPRSDVQNNDFLRLPLLPWKLPRLHMIEAHFSMLKHVTFFTQHLHSLENTEKLYSGGKFEEFLSHYTLLIFTHNNMKKIQLCNNVGRRALSKTAVLILSLYDRCDPKKLSNWRYLIWHASFSRKSIALSDLN